MRNRWASTSLFCDSSSCSRSCSSFWMDSIAEAIRSAPAT